MLLLTNVDEYSFANAVPPMHAVHEIHTYPPAKCWCNLVQAGKQSTITFPLGSQSLHKNCHFLEPPLILVPPTMPRVNPGRDGLVFEKRTTNELTLLSPLFLLHRAESSSELATQTRASEVRASVVTEWPPACLHKLLPRGHQRDDWWKPRIKEVSNLTHCSLVTP